MPNILAVLSLIKLELLAEFVDRIVRQVHEDVLDVSILLVFVCCEAREAVVVEEDPERIDAGQKNIDSEIKLQPIDQERIPQVLLYDQSLQRRNLISVLNQINPLPLR